MNQYVLILESIANITLIKHKKNSYTREKRS